MHVFSVSRYMLFFSETWDQFTSIDRDGDSRLSLQEFQTGCKRLGEASFILSSTSDHRDGLHSE
jgi:hypothetical protein